MQTDICEMQTDICAMESRHVLGVNGRSDTIKTYVLINNVLHLYCTRGLYDYTM